MAALQSTGALSLPNESVIAAGQCVSEFGGQVIAWDCYWSWDSAHSNCANQSNGSLTCLLRGADSMSFLLMRERTSARARRRRQRRRRRRVLCELLSCWHRARRAGHSEWRVADTPASSVPLCASECYNARAAPSASDAPLSCRSPLQLLHFLCLLSVRPPRRFTCISRLLRALPIAA